MNHPHFLVYENSLIPVSSLEEAQWVRSPCWVLWRRKQRCPQNPVELMVETGPLQALRSFKYVAFMVVQNFYSCNKYVSSILRVTEFLSVSGRMFLFYTLGWSKLKVFLEFLKKTTSWWVFYVTSCLSARLEAGISPDQYTWKQKWDSLGESLFWECMWFCGKSVALGFLVASVCRRQGGCGFRGNLLCQRRERVTATATARGNLVASFLNSQTFPSEIPEWRASKLVPFWTCRIWQSPGPTGQ